MAKPDIVDVYKNIPACTQDLRLQGFMWEGRFFVELRQMFGACSSVQNFDIVVNTINTVAKVGCRIPSRFVLRQLDDVPIVAPGKSGWCEEFLLAYKHLRMQPNKPRPGRRLPGIQEVFRTNHKRQNSRNLVQLRNPVLETTGKQKKFHPPGPGRSFEASKSLPPTAPIFDG